jgi:hypothetical protein
VFKLNKDGTGYAVLHSFDGEDRSSPSGLVQGRDGALYGTTPYAYNMLPGTVFVLRPQPVLLAPMLSANGMIVRFVSVPGSTNQLQRASALGESWLTLTNMLASTNGVAEFIDIAPPQTKSFYRVVRQP